MHNTQTNRYMWDYFSFQDFHYLHEFYYWKLKIISHLKINASLEQVHPLDPPLSWIVCSYKHWHVHQAAWECSSSPAHWTGEGASVIQVCVIPLEELLTH